MGADKENLFELVKAHVDEMNETFSDLAALKLLPPYQATIDNSGAIPQLIISEK